MLFVHAHPDDETLTTGATIAHYAARLTAIENTFGSTQDQLHVLIGQLGDYEVVSV